MGLAIVVPIACSVTALAYVLQHSRLSNFHPPARVCESALSVLNKSFIGCGTSFALINA